MNCNVIGYKEGKKINLYANMNGCFLGDFRRAYIGCIKYDRKINDYVFCLSFYLTNVRGEIIESINKIIKELKKK